MDKSWQFTKDRVHFKPTPAATQQTIGLSNVGKEYGVIKLTRADVSHLINASCFSFVNVAIFHILANEI